MNVNRSGVTGSDTGCIPVVSCHQFECTREKAQYGGVMMVEADETRQRRCKRVEK